LFSCGDVVATFELFALSEVTLTVILELACELGMLATMFSVAESLGPVPTFVAVELLIKN
jgi:hypothetical protein